MRSFGRFISTPFSAGSRLVLSACPNGATAILCPKGATQDSPGQGSAAPAALGYVTPKTSLSPVRATQSAAHSATIRSLAAICLLAFTLTATAAAQDAPSRTKKPGVTPERQAAVMTFVKRNHPELADLLAHLKARQPDEYEGAVRELFRTTERLAQIQERDAAQYELEAALWTAQSRVQLLTAKLMMGTTDELQAALRTAVGEQIDARVALLRHQRQKAADRASNLQREIDKVENDRDQTIDRQLQLLTRAASEGRPAGIVPANSTKNSKPGKKAKPAAE